MEAGSLTMQTKLCLKMLLSYAFVHVLSLISVKQACRCLPFFFFFTFVFHKPFLNDSLFFLPLYTVAVTSFDKYVYVKELSDVSIATRTMTLLYLSCFPKPGHFSFEWVLNFLRLLREKACKWLVFCMCMCASYKFNI